MYEIPATLECGKHNIHAWTNEKIIRQIYSLFSKTVIFTKFLPEMPVKEGWLQPAPFIKTFREWLGFFSKEKKLYRLQNHQRQKTQNSFALHIVKLFLKINLVFFISLPFLKTL